MNKIDLGAVSAYALAKEKGYQGTEEQFATLMMQSGDNALRAEAAADRAEDILGSIPPEYTELSNQVGENKGNVAALTAEVDSIDIEGYERQTKTLSGTVTNSAFWDETNKAVNVSGWSYLTVEIGGNARVLISGTGKTFSSTVLRIPTTFRAMTSNVHFASWAKVGTEYYWFVSAFVAASESIQVPSEMYGMKVTPVVSEYAAVNNDLVIDTLDVMFTRQGYLLVKLSR